MTTEENFFVRQDVTGFFTMLQGPRARGGAGRGLAECGEARVCGGAGRGLALSQILLCAKLARVVPANLALG